MKRSLFLYLFIMAALMCVFTYAYYSKQTTEEQREFKLSTAKMRDSLNLVKNQLEDANYFSLEKNENAKEYLADYNTAELIPKITNKILELNTLPEGNSLVPYDKINGEKFVVNKVKVLNHRWIIADFSDGTIWGELLLKYFIEDDGSITFERMDAQLYQKRAE